MLTLKIELRVDHIDPSKDDLIREAAKVAAKHLLTTALLIQDKQRPQIAVSGSDFFTAEEEILLADDIPDDEEIKESNDDT